MNSSIWKSDKKLERKARVSERTKNFFDSLQITEAQKKTGLTYRKGQEEMAINVCDSIYQDNILIQSAGVGIGKSFAYLIPLMYLIDEYVSQGKEIGPVLISTSSKALQKQLLRDVECLKNVLGLTTDISASISLGMNNYACLKKIERECLGSSLRESEIQLLKKLENLISKKETSELSTLDIKLSNYLEQRIKANFQDCFKCKNHYSCPVRKELKKVSKSNIVITNHGQLTNWATNNTPMLTNASAVVIDEAHHLEEAIRSTQEESLKMEDIIIALDNSNCSLKKKKQLISLIKNFFISIKANTVNNDLDNNQNNNCLNYKQQRVQKASALLQLKLKEYFPDIDIEYKSAYKREDKYYQILKKLFDFCSDITKDNCKYIYSSTFYLYNNDKRVILKRTPKDIKKTIHKIVASRPAVITSATLPLHIKEDLGIEGEELQYNTRKHISTPYDFSNNAVFYQRKNSPEPPKTHLLKDNSAIYNDYIEDLAKKISSQIKLSEGRSLVLFTSKKVAQDTYEKVKELMQKYNSNSNNKTINLFIQEEDADKTIKKFKNDINSVLFSYGLWEGMNIKGESLSQVIITRLPFPNVTPLLNYKASKYSEEEVMRQIYIPEMTLKLVQGLGRGIRGETDKCAYICLDGRYSKYQSDIDNAINTYFPGTKIVGNNGPVKRLLKVPSKKDKK